MSAEELSAYLDGELDAARAAQVRAALEVNQDLRAEYESLRWSTEFLRSAPPPPLPEGVKLGLPKGAAETAEAELPTGALWRAAVAGWQADAQARKHEREAKRAARPIWRWGLAAGFGVAVVAAIALVANQAAWVGDSRRTALLEPAEQAPGAAGPVDEELEAAAPADGLDFGGDVPEGDGDGADDATEELGPIAAEEGAGEVAGSPVGTEAGPVTGSASEDGETASTEIANTEGSGEPTRIPEMGGGGPPILEMLRDAAATAEARDQSGSATSEGLERDSIVESGGEDEAEEDLADVASEPAAESVAALESSAKGTLSSPAASLAEPGAGDEGQKALELEDDAENAQGADASFAGEPSENGRRQGALMVALGLAAALGGIAAGAAFLRRRMARNAARPAE